MDTLHVALAAVPFVLQCALLVRMCTAGMRRQYPLFFCFVVTDVLASAVTFCLWRMGPETYAVFFYTYWILSLLGAALGFGVLWEILSLALRNYPELERMAGIGSRFVIAVFLVVAVVLAAADAAGRSGGIVAAVMVLQRSIYLIQAGAVLVLLLAKAELGLAWRQPLLGIALGFSLYVISQLVIFAARTEMGPVANWTLQLLVPVSYNLAVITWLAFLWRAGAPALRLEAGLHTRLARWDRVLAEVSER